MGFFGCGEVKDAEGIEIILCGDGRKVSEVGVDGETGFDDACFRESLADECGACALIGDEPEVGGSLAPCGVDFDGVCNHGDDRDFRASFFKDTFKKVGVERVGADDDLGVMLGDDFAELFLRFAHHREMVFGEILFFCGEVNFSPKPWSVGGDPAVKVAEAGVEEWGTQRAGVGDHGAGVGFEGKVEIARSAVMAIAEAGGEDKDIRLMTHGCCAHGGG